MRLKLRKDEIECNVSYLDRFCNYSRSAFNGIELSGPERGKSPANSVIKISSEDTTTNVSRSPGVTLNIKLGILRVKASAPSSPNANQTRTSRKPCSRIMREMF